MVKEKLEELDEQTDTILYTGSNYSISASISNENILELKVALSKHDDYNEVIPKDVSLCDIKEEKPDDENVTRLENLDNQDLIDDYNIVLSEIEKVFDTIWSIEQRRGNLVCQKCTSGVLIFNEKINVNKIEGKIGGDVNK